MKSGSEVHFIEIMACPGGCVNGGGQIIDADTETSLIFVPERAKALSIDSSKLKSHETQKFNRFAGS